MKCLSSCSVLFRSHRNHTGQHDPDECLLHAVLEYSKMKCRHHFRKGNAQQVLPTVLRQANTVVSVGSQGKTAAVISPQSAYSSQRPIIIRWHLDERSRKHHFDGRLAVIASGPRARARQIRSRYIPQKLLPAPVLVRMLLWPCKHARAPSRPDLRSSTNEQLGAGRVRPFAVLPSVQLRPRRRRISRHSSSSAT